ncbi:class-II aminoacyl-tRNA synthetase family protein [Streptomyces olivaceus]|uniref:hypothetical protein n=1 Tax=Streptomyces olivaceus TaxID=47716 RepID=UPI00188547CC|nr:hypothetical protein [Streptomyces olivaceus]
MKSITLNLPAETSRDVRETLLQNIYWIDRAVRQVDLVRGNPLSLVVTCADDGKADALEETILSEVARMLSASTAVGQRVVRENAGHRIPGLGADEVLRELSERGWVSEEVPGVSIHSGLMADLYFGLERTFRRVGQKLGAREVRLPSLLGTETLLRAGYLRANAHQVNYVFHLHEDGPAVARFAESCSPESGNVRISGIPSSSSEPEAVLSPAACQPLYHMLSGQQLAQPFLVTGQVQCFRYESRATDGLRRAREYGVREVVHVGCRSETDSFRERLLEACWELVESFELRGKLETASDPFFLDASAQYRVFQLAVECKHELQLAVGSDGDSVAVASVNHHGDHFGRAWQIRAEDGQIAQSCCLGFGIDRWCLAVFSQFGFEPRTWPARLQKVLLSDD